MTSAESKVPEVQDVPETKESPVFYSQINQDREVIQYFKGKRNGYFVELGASDGINLSNTLTLEKYYNWNGICIEPLPSVFESLKLNRKCKCYNYLVSEKDGNEEELFEAQDSLLSGIKQDINCHVHILSFPKNLYKMKTRSLTSVLDEAGAPNIIDFLSLDTEGSELKILFGLDFNKYNFRYICIEHNYVEPTRTFIRKYLESKNYKFLGENKWDDNYVYIPEIELTNQ